MLQYEDDSIRQYWREKLKRYTIREHELNDLMSLSNESSISLNIALFLLSLSISGFITIWTTETYTISNWKTIYIISSIVSFIIAILLFIYSFIRHKRLKTIGDDIKCDKPQKKK